MLSKFFSLSGIAISLLAFLCPPPPALAQVAINVEWQNQSAAPATEFDYSVSDFDVYENFYVAGNSVIPGEEANFWLIKYDPEGGVVWETTLDFDAGDDYVTSIIVGDHGDVWVAGPSFNVSDSSFDYAVAMIDSSGSVQWQNQYNGTWGKDDFPVSMQQNNAGYLFVGGTTEGDTTGRDYTVIKLDATDGSEQWTTSYDYANFDDVGVGLELDEDDQTVTMSGASASTANSYDFATIKFNMSDGELDQSNRYVAGVQGYNSPVAICKDDYGNVYVTGRAVGSSSFDTQTLKLDSTLSLQWARTWDGSGLEDGGQDLKVDNWGNVYVTGYKQNANFGYEYVTLKYDQTGLLLWEKPWAAAGDTDTAQTTYLALDASNNVYVTGSVQNASTSTSYLFTIVYDTDGNVQWSIEYETPGTAEGVPADMRVNLLGDVYLTGKTNDTNGNEFVSMKYKVLPMPSEYAYDSLGNPLYVKHQLVVRFAPSLVDSSFVDNLDLMYGKVTEVINDTTFIDSMGQEIGVGTDLRDWYVKRVYSSLTTSDTIGLALSGDTFDIPPLWSTFVLVIPEVQPESSDTLELEYAGKLGGSAFENDIMYAIVNQIGRVFSNDPEFGKQASLTSTTYPNGDINMTSAWNLLESRGLTIGSDDITVGIFDSGVLFNHEDFGVNGGFSGVSGSVVQSGLDFLNNPPSTSNTTKGDHGTRMAGIIGALRDNNKGVAGIAGGDHDNQDPNLRKGIYLSPFNITFPGGLLVDLTAAQNALVNAATSGVGNSPTVDVINNSWGFEDDPNGSVAIPAKAGLRDPIRLAYNSGIIICNARGQRSVNSGVGFSPTVDVFPATYRDDWGISTGGADLEGNRHEAVGVITYNGTLDIFSFYSKGMDILAPSIRVENPSIFASPNELLFTTNVPSQSFPTLYTTSGGSSSACAHTSGVAALLQGIDLNQTLAIEDVEHLIEYSAQDRPFGTNLIVGYDSETAWGLLDAYGAVSLLDRPSSSVFREVVQRKVSVGTNINHNHYGTLLQSGQVIQFQYAFDHGGVVVPGKTNVTVDVYKYIAIDTYQPGPNGRLISAGPGTDRPGYWARNSASNLWTLPNSSGLIEPEPNITVSATQSAPGAPINVTVVGYYYEVTNPGTTNLGTGAWLPRSSWWRGDLAYSLLVEEGTSTDIDFESIEKAMAIYPSPAKSELRIRFATASDVEDAEVSLYDLTGKELLLSESTQTGKELILSIPEAISTGTYVCKVQGSDFSFQKLIVINKE